ncbi:AbrB/MazE/SpoVT family DNA-binding domain-containing protein [Candidatus Halobeggiatoa sp. HSG11]|nr:AbrB/MazE/SpoVT family DNA-binding domain-containing protein [Candidatus Halobeggiatoa sp. HSG11]
MTTAIAKWGNSAALRLPKNILNSLNLKIGDKVNIISNGSKIVIEPSKPNLEQLLNMVTQENKHNELLIDSAGKELL